MVKTSAEKRSVIPFHQTTLRSALKNFHMTSGKDSSSTASLSNLSIVEYMIVLCQPESIYSQLGEGLGIMSVKDYIGCIIVLVIVG